MILVMMLEDMDDLKRFFDVVVDETVSPAKRSTEHDHRDFFIHSFRAWSTLTHQFLGEISSSSPIINILFTLTENCFLNLE